MKHGFLRLSPGVIVAMIIMTLTASGQSFQVAQHPDLGGMWNGAAAGINRGAAVAGGRVYAVVNGSLVALHAATGQLLWTQPPERIGVPKTMAASPQHLAVLNRALADALPHRRVVQSGRGFSLGWDDTDDLRRMLWPVALSAVELLAGDHAAPVKLCGMRETTGCSWLFVDESRNGSRRWCSMKDCGNRAKARRHYRKVKRLD